MKGWTQQALAAKGLRIMPAPTALELAPKAKRSKYGAVRTEWNGRWFDSKGEAERAQQLTLLERARVIRGLGFQPRFPLRGPDGEKVCTYVGDFRYFDNGREVVEDFKSKPTLTQAARIKLKMFRAQFPHIELRLITATGERLRCP